MTGYAVPVRRQRLEVPAVLGDNPGTDDRTPGVSTTPRATVWLCLLTGLLATPARAAGDDTPGPSPTAAEILTRMAGAYVNALQDVPGFGHGHDGHQGGRRRRRPDGRAAVHDGVCPPGPVPDRDERVEGRRESRAPGDRVVAGLDVRTWVLARRGRVQKPNSPAEAFREPLGVSVGSAYTVPALLLPELGIGHRLSEAAGTERLDDARGSATSTATTSRAATATSRPPSGSTRRRSWCGGSTGTSGPRPSRPTRRSSTPRSSAPTCPPPGSTSPLLAPPMPTLGRKPLEPAVVFGDDDRPGAKLAVRGPAWPYTSRLPAHGARSDLMAGIFELKALGSGKPMFTLKAGNGEVILNERETRRVRVGRREGHRLGPERPRRAVRPQNVEGRRAANLHSEGGQRRGHRRQRRTPRPPRWRRASRRSRPTRPGPSSRT